MINPLRKILEDSNNPKSLFIIALLNYLLEKNDVETEDFLTKINDKNDEPNWEILNNWSDNTKNEKDIKATQWVQDKEDFLDWMKKDHHFVGLAIAIQYND